MANATQTALEGLRKRDLIAFLERDERVREWLAGPERNDDGHPVPDGGALLGTKAAAEFLGVERNRLWRWEKSGRLTRALTTSATPLYLRAELEALRAELDEQARARAEREAAE
jgi:hypothetical protein